jgi:hypothetical protein
MKSRFLLLPILAFVAFPSFAIEPLAIQDNSFFIEEAYNQEPGVYQYIFTFADEDGEQALSFTNEIPVGGQRHQFSYTLTGVRSGGERGFGDAMINYRYQLAGDGNARLAVSPRVSLIVPTGDDERGLGSGEWGYELNLPVSWAVNDRVVTHWNAGVTDAGDASWFAGGSVIAAPFEKFHVMLETRWSGDDEASDVVVSPGIRWAWDLANGFQVVPGIAVPVSDGDAGLFFYLSLER